MLELLEKIGLSKREAIIYAALLDTGQTTTGPLIKKTRIPGSKIYGVLDRLIYKGLVSVVTKHNTKHFSATNPERLLDYLEEKKEGLEKQETEVRKMLPYLKKQREKGAEEHEAEVAYGLEGLKNFAYKMLAGATNEDEWLFFSFSVKDPERYMKVFNFYRSFDKPRTEKLRGIKGILPMYVKKATGRREANLCYVDFPIPTNTTICGDMVMFTPWEDEEISYLIYSRHLANSLRDYFYSIFNKYKKGKKIKRKKDA